ncbi:MAG TPA: hypothetical protein VJJ82_00030 [Candidatus Nanoarchaeia archaeon]|nr:hypothetical protein [Candidatus Nanoarchaeia archaeon]
MHEKRAPDLLLATLISGGIFFALGLLFAPYFSGNYTGKAIAHISDQQISATSNRVCVQQAGLRYVSVDSPSMEPLINIHTLVVEKTPRSPLDIQTGDIISFYEPLGKQNILHVVTAVVPTNQGVSYRTRGWANQAEDPWLVPFSNVKGVVVAIVR